MLTRRNLLAGASAVVLFRDDTISRLLRADYPFPVAPSDAAQDEAYWSKVRGAFDVESEFLYLNNGGVCPSPRSVRSAAQSRVDIAARAPAYHLFRKQEHEIELVRTRVAKFFEADREEIAIMPNASQGLFAVIMGLSLKSGDRILTTSMDYPRVHTAFRQRARRDNISADIIDAPANPASQSDFIAPIKQALRLGPRLVSITSVSHLNGAVFPVAEICQMAKSSGAFTLVDGAHAVGQMPETAKSVGSDAYAACLHKWVLGPVGTGFLYVRKDKLSDIWSLYPSDASLEKNIRKFEQFGTHNSGILLSIQEALDAHEAIGTERKGARLAYLREYLFQKLSELPNVAFGSTRPATRGRVLLAVRFTNKPTNVIVSALMSKHKIFVTTAAFEGQTYLRISPQIFTSLKELDQLVNALKVETGA